MAWETQYSKRKRFFSNVGEKEVQKFKPVFDTNGHMELEPCGKDNLYDFIQSWAESVDIHVLMKKYQNGDITALNQRQGQFIDIADFPTSYAEMFNLMQEAEDKFYELDPSIRAKFNHNFREYLAMSQENPQQFVDLLGGSPVRTVDNIVEKVDNEVGPDSSKEG